jgi:translocation and assembly module TamB
MNKSKAFKKTILAVLLIMTFFIMLVSALVATQAGSRWALQQLSQALGIRLGEVRGNLLTGLDVSNLDFDKSGLTIHAEKIQLRWQPLALFYTSISVQSLSAEKIRIHIPLAKDKPQPDLFEWPSFALPVRVELGKLQLRDIIVAQGTQEFALDSVGGSLSLGTFHFRINDFVVSNKEFYSKNNGSVALRYPYGVDLTTEWKFLSPASSNMTLVGNLHTSGDIEKIKLKSQLAQPAHAEASAALHLALNIKGKLPTASIEVQWPEQNIPKQLLENIPSGQTSLLSQLLSTQGELKLQGWLDSYKLDGVVSAKTTNTLYRLNMNLNGTHVLASRDKGAAVKLQIDKAELVSETLESTGGDPEKNRLYLNGTANLLPLLQWDLHLRGEHIHIEQFYSGWPSDLQVDLNIKGNKIASKTASVPSWRAIANDFTVQSQLSLQGELRATQLVAKANLALAEGDLQSSDMNVTFGANQFFIANKIPKNKKTEKQKSMTFEWKIDAPLLSQIDPRIKGSIVSAGIFDSDFIDGLATGDAKDSQFVTTTHINQLVWGDYSVEKLHLNAKSSKSHVYNLLLDAERLRIHSWPFSKAFLDINGSAAQHALKASLKTASDDTVKFEVAGSWQDQQWRGNWRNFSLGVRKIPEWYLSSSLPMVVNANRAELGNMCLTSAIDAVDAKSVLIPKAAPYSYSLTHLLSTITGQAAQKNNVMTQEIPQICITSLWENNSGFNLVVNSVAIPLRQARAWLKPEVSVSGVLDSQFKMQFSNKEPLSASLGIQSRDAHLSYQFRGSNTNVYQLKQGNFNALLKNNQIDSTLILDGGQYGSVNAEAKYSLTDKKIRGKMSALLSDLAPLESLVPALNDVQGAATADIDVAGNIDKPEVTGNLSVVNARANVPKLGLDFTEMSLQLASKMAGLIHMEGQVLSGKGRLMLKGDLTNLGAENWHCSGNIFGADISIIQQPELSATISPNLTFTADSGAINLNGSTEIPWARTAIKTLPANATRVSNDVTLVTSTDSFELSEARKNNIPFYTNVLLYFGDDVRFKGFGLDGQLSGKITVFKEENRQAQTTGFVAINQGIYKAYGQELTIARGRLLFQGPYDNPGLDIRAIRIIDTETAGKTITAGIEVGGTLQRPKSTVFSIPARDDSNAMALLLTGKSKDQLSIADAYVLVNAVDNMGVENGSSIIEEVTDFFKLDEITIKSDKGLEQSVLWVGKYITPKLFMRYVVGLYDQAFTLGMRYQLTEKLRLEATSGKEQGVDMIYKIER